MNEQTIINPFKTAFLDQFVLVPDRLPFTDSEIIKLDKELTQYEKVFLNPDIEKNLISKSELLVSFAISKAERSTLTLPEAQEIYDFLLSNAEYRFIAKKIKKGQKLTQKDHDKLEFFNIAKTFRSLNSQRFDLNDLTPVFIQKIHGELTKGLDIFKDHFEQFELYRSGSWRSNNLIRVGTYAPADYKVIKKGVRELISYIRQKTTPTKIAVFHTALYALHPFNNGNKRVSRILEHLLLRSIGFNHKNLYSASYYYHKEKARYYKYLLYSLERQNLNHFVAFIQEALVLSIISVVQISLESKRKDFLQKQPDEIKLILKPLIKRNKLQFKHLVNNVKKKMSRQTFVNHLQKAVETQIVTRVEAGRSTYYHLNLQSTEEKTISEWLKLAQSKLSYIPNEIRLV